MAASIVRIDGEVCRRISHINRLQLPQGILPVVARKEKGVVKFSFEIQGF